MRRCLLLLVCLAGCAEEAPPPVVEAPGPPELSVPASGMDAAVATLVNDGWSTLQTSLSQADATDASRAEAYATFGLLCFGNGLTATAETAFQNAVYLVPDEPRWIYFLALIHQFTGELGLAGDGFERVLALDPNQLAATIRLGDVRFEQGNFDAANQAYRVAAEVQEYRAAAHYGLGRAADASGDDALAISNYETALSLQPNADRINYLLGLAWQRSGDSAKAQTYLSQFGTIEPAFPDPLFDQISGGETQIGGLWANMNAGSQAFVDGDYVLATEKFQQATEDHPDDPRSWESLGMALRRTGDTADAATAYQKAVALSPENGDLAVAHAEVLVELGQDKAALEALQTAAANNTDDATVRMAYGMMLAQAGDANAAIEEINAAINVAETSEVRARAHYSLGRVQAGLGNGTAAASAFEAALTANPDHGGARLELARTQVRARNFETALNSYLAYLANNPRNDAARIEAATAAIFLSDVKRARSLMEEGIASGEASARQQSSLARLLVLVTDPDVRDPQAALEHANDALQVTGARQHAETLALCLSALGRFDEAVRVQTEVLADAEAQGDTAARDRAVRNLEAYQLRRLGRLPLDSG